MLLRYPFYHAMHTTLFLSWISPALWFVLPSQQITIFLKKKICEKKARLNSEILYFSQVLKGALFRTATEQKEQTRYFSKSVLVLIAFPVIVCLIFY